MALSIPEAGTEYGIWRVKGPAPGDRFKRSRVKMACVACARERIALVSDLNHGKYPATCRACPERSS